ncbi:tetratricopeptide repeat protein, partial [bacterium]|nr:tetratricopeptide repeat protein [bacterium]
LLMDSLDISDKMNGLFKKYNFQDIIRIKDNCTIENYSEQEIAGLLQENKGLIDVLMNSVYSLNKTLEAIDSLFNKGCLTLESSEAVMDEITEFYPDEVKFLTQESDLFKEGYEYYMKGLYNQSLKIFEETFKIFPNSPVLSLFITKCYLFNRDMKKALSLLKKMNVEFTDNILIQLFLARIFMRLNKLDDAGKYLLHALKKNPNNIAVLWEYANLLFRKKQVDKSIETYKKILSTQPDNINTLNKLAAIYLKNNDHKNAILYWEQVLGFDKENTIAFTNLKVIKK